MGLLSPLFAPEKIEEMRGNIRERILREAAYVRQGNFIRLGEADLRLLFRLYDQLFFAGQLQPAVMAACGTSVSFRTSGAMTSSGGKCTRYRQRIAGEVRTQYEIAISARLLFNSFAEGGRTVRVSGAQCVDRLDALMRIMEHELVHLLEMLTFGNSSCSKSRFLTIASRFFGHRHAKHQLVTAREHAQRKHDLKVGDQVRFRADGKELCGLLNRVAVRGTVLVPHASGRRYSDGQRYAKYYVPLARLTPLRSAGAP